ncbi:MAG: plasmid recombination protein [Oscillospiraceae bacterium]|nr:plasmid recombination protein [Oscillospiraceae bacterium]
MAKVRATMHNGRGRNSVGFKVRHNDRDFDTTRAEHINQEPERRNRYFIVETDGTVNNRPEISFETHEKRMYATLFSESLSKQAERHIKGGHSERVRTTDQYRTATRTSPEETILQLGTREEHADPQAFIKAVNRWCQQMQATYGTNWRLLDGALHFDESTPHCHIRAVWIAEGKDGLQVSENKALKALGIQRPDPEQPEGKHNCPKQTFTRQSRELWIAAAREFGIEIEDIPEMPGKATRTKEEYIAQKIRKEIVELTEQRDQVRAEVSLADSARATLREEVAGLQKTKGRLEGAIARLRKVLLPILLFFKNRKL